ncbi:MAG TPA: hypothetical protein VF681_15260 [Abditibacteriaceae bacterium]|jgi:hypothetical protein
MARFFFLAPVLLVVALPAHAETRQSSSISASRVGIWRETPLWQTRTTPLSHRDSMNAIANEVSVLARLRDWRGTLNGTGNHATRRWAMASLGNQKLQLAFGAHALQSISLLALPTTVSGTSLQLGRVSAGSTWRPRELDELAQNFDGLMTGKATPQTNAPRWAWIAARPIEHESGNLDLLFAQKSHNGNDRNFSGARGEWNAPLRWKLRGEVSQSGEETADARAWKLDANGPILHPWGEANASAQWQSTQSGFLNASESSAEAARRRSLAIQQDIAAGDISGTAVFSLAQAQPMSEFISDELALREEAEGKANVRWRLSPSFAVIGGHSRKAVAQRRKTEVVNTEIPTAEPATEAPLGNEDSPATETALSSQVWDIAQENHGEAGIEWRMSRSLALKATAGQTRIARSMEGAGMEHSLASTEERNRLALGLERRTNGGAWSIGFARQLQAAQTNLDKFNEPTGAQTDSVQLAGERNLGPGLRIKGALGLANALTLEEQLLESRTTRSVEAQWSLDVGRLDLRVGDSNGVKLAGAGSQLDGTREWAARFNLGSAAKGNGLGLALEYSRRDDQSAKDSAMWRVGVTYK